MSFELIKYVLFGLLFAGGTILLSYAKNKYGDVFSDSFDSYIKDLRAKSIRETFKNFDGVESFIDDINYWAFPEVSEIDDDIINEEFEKFVERKQMDLDMVAIFIDVNNEVRQMYTCIMVHKSELLEDGIDIENIDISECLANPNIRKHVFCMGIKGDQMIYNYYSKESI
jgi:hypothetical protein